MVKSRDKREDEAGDDGGSGPQPGIGAGAPAGQAPQPPQASQPPQIEVDDSKALASYANFCRVTGTPEEVLIDFGLNEHPFGAQTHPLPITQRIITNYYTAKRLLQVLHMTVGRYEATFGVLEIDVQKRIRQQAGRPPRQP